jgi:hypothetical protein
MPRQLLIKIAHAKSALIFKFVLIACFGVNQCVPSPCLHALQHVRVIPLAFVHCNLTANHDRTGYREPSRMVVPEWKPRLFPCAPDKAP